MSDNIPQRPGVEEFTQTEAPVEPCTGNFIEVINCRDYSVFFYLGGFCVLVMIIGLCSCCVVGPLVHWIKDSRGGPPPDPPFHQQPRTRPRAEEESSGGREARQVAPKKARVVKKNPSDGFFHSNFHHWYLNRALTITNEDIRELGPRNAYAAKATKEWAQEQRRRRQEQGGVMGLSRGSSSSRVGGSSRAAPYAGATGFGDDAAINIEAGVVDDPGVGAFATARGGGWMGAANGR